MKAVFSEILKKPDNVLGLKKYSIQSLLYQFIHFVVIKVYCYQFIHFVVTIAGKSATIQDFPI